MRAGDVGSCREVCAAVAGAQSVVLLRALSIVRVPMSESVEYGFPSILLVGAVSSSMWLRECRGAG